MNIFKKVLIGLLIVTALIFIAALVAPKKFHAKGETTINKPISEVYNYVKSIKTQEEYSIWFEEDPNIIKNYYGKDGEIGSGLKWQSEIVGNGEQKIKNLSENKKVEIDLYLMDNSKANHLVYEMDELSPNKTKLTIEVDGETPIPFNLMSLMYDMNASFQQNADNLKKVLEDK
ncbi:SRPBCC family protein [Amniculibacterium aquaticum]|uniref:SRPBCC family protein n=1 Tax=Amniculibacterium aquaticum TaxID=2479858 RepID=UPI000F59C099|nr:SRPBCC family protein [Amniculibacterium aquaticum]